jgi:hypothetical protein
MNWTKLWNDERKKLKVLFESLGITHCEIMLPGCWFNNALGFAHRHKRKWYYDKPELLGDFNQVLLACNICHDKIEDDVELTEKYFRIRRELK